MENFDLEKDEAPQTDAVLEMSAASALSASLYVVATPIGNLGDVSPRMRDTLAMVDVVAAEDTRVTAQLLSLLGLKKPLVPSHGHNAKASAQTLIEKLHAGQNIALVSDAGTPAVSDPGAWVVKEVAAAGFPVIPVPGPSAVLAAVAGSGLVEGPFYFAGFMPSKGGARAKALAAVLERSESVVLFEAPHRIEALFDEILALGAHLRECCVARELTKKFETFYRGTAESVAALLAADGNGRRGEFVVVLGPKPVDVSAPVLASVNPFELLDALLEHLPNKTAVKLVVQATGSPRNALYDHALKKGGDLPD
ncbi:MAG: 16S rRNA (cytidine(1402)-2'-O)-methyltransferase [Burkholderiales bacterium]|nr:16S rRNA (cytidine(1402)-2'-O)-methyltransferase [Burkholderiales bacterium]